MCTIKPKEACGVFAISIETGVDLEELMTPGLKSLQHRGEDGVGIAYNEGQKSVEVIKSTGLVADMCFHQKEKLSSMHGSAGIGHVRYGTQGSNALDYVQPFTRPGGQIAVAFNGQLKTLSYGSDTERLYERFKTYLETRDVKTFRALDTLVETGPDEAFSVVGMNDDTVFAYRDSRGTRPLFYAEFKAGDKKAVAVASETCAFNHLYPLKIHEIQPGQLVEIRKGLVVNIFQGNSNNVGFCAFEGLYFSREDSLLKIQTMYDVRKQLGRELASEDMCISNDIDVVIGVPQSGLPAALGYAQQINCPFEFGIIKSRYKGRSFIQSDDEKRKTLLMNKLHVQSSVVKDKNIVVVDDTLVRGHTMKYLVACLRDAGAKAVHVRIAAPPIISPCTKGVDTGRETKLPASTLQHIELESFIGADSLGFLSISNLKKVLGDSICLDCFL